MKKPDADKIDYSVTIPPSPYIPSSSTTGGATSSIGELTGQAAGTKGRGRGRGALSVPPLSMPPRPSTAPAVQPVKEEEYFTSDQGAQDEENTEIIQGERTPLLSGACMINGKGLAPDGK